MTITPEELQLAARNHGMPLEALRFDVTPVGLHYLLVHYDVPVVDPTTWRLEVGGAVERPLSLSLDDLRLHAHGDAGGDDGVRRQRPRAAGAAAALAAVAARGGRDRALDRHAADAAAGGGRRGARCASRSCSAGSTPASRAASPQTYERSLALAEAQRPDVLLAWA